MRRIVDASKCWCCKENLEAEQRGRDYYCKACGVYLPWSWYGETVSARLQAKQAQNVGSGTARPDNTSAVLAYSVCTERLMDRCVSNIEIIDKCVYAGLLSKEDAIRILTP